MRSYAEWILRRRVMVIALTLLVTAFALSQAKNLKVIIDPNTMLPQSHPYVIATNTVERIFGSKYVIVVGITPKQGDVFQPEVLVKVQRITSALLETPDVVKENLLSLSARRAKNIMGNEEGLEVRPMMAQVPRTPEQMESLRQALQANPVYRNAIISNDNRTTTVLVEFRNGPGGFRSMMDKINPIVDRERDASVDIALGGLPVFLSRIEIFSERMAYLVPLATLLVGLIHFEAFRTIQGLVLPLVTALLAVAWGLGAMGFAGIPLDVFNATTPILILAVAAGHAVQLLKRYYEEYHRVRDTTDLSPSEANKEAVVQSLSHIGLVMITAGTIAALGFFSLMVFEIRTVRTFGMFTGIGIISALILEMTFTPAIRSMLPAPGEKELRLEGKNRIWDRIAGALARWITGPRHWMNLAVFLLVLAVAFAGMQRVVVDNSTKSYFSEDFQFRKDDNELNNRLGGTNTLYLLIEGADEDAIKDPKILQAMESTQRFLESQPFIGKTISIADFIKRMNQALHGDDPAYFSIPESRELISQYLLLYSISGEPGDFDTYVDYGYKTASITVYLKTDSSAYLQELIGKINAKAIPLFGSDVKIGIGGSVPQGSALNEVMVRSKIFNIAQIGAVVLVISSLVFRSLLAGFLVLTPLLLAVLVNFGLMGWTGILLNISNSLSSAMAVGIGADYAIYLIYRLREELARGVDEATSVRNVLNTAGKASMFVASAVAGGYGMLLFSFGFYMHIWLAILIATAMLVSVFTALTLIPSLIMRFRPGFIFKQASVKLQPAPAVAGLLVLMALLTPGLACADETAISIMEKNFMVSKVVDSVSDATFTLINKSGQERVRKTFGTTKLEANGIDNMRMTRFVSPPDIKGTVSLLVEHSEKDDDIWIYLPGLKKVRRLVSSNKKDSFVGTDFSYGDVIGHKVMEWEHKLVKEEEVDGKPCYVIESLPKNETIKSSSGYSKRLGWIRKDNFVTIKGEMWDEAGQLIKTSAFKDVQLVDPDKAKWQPMRLETTNVQTGHHTIIQLDKFKVNQKVADDYFTTRYMEREP
jgi:predicted RND superfamily exporter protein/outer membrane lipoprotein-sorting protein